MRTPIEVTPRQLRGLVFFIFVAVVCSAAQDAAAQFDPPASYYNSATGTGSTLKSQLHNIIDNHTVFSYGDARTILQDTDEDPNDSDRMLLVYNRVSLDVSAINPGGSIPGWDSGNSWNREHTWPRSRGVDSSGPDNSDLHQLRPSNPSVNSQRGNLNFGGAFGQSFGSVSDGGTFWYPGDADAGMIARQQFYMAVRYDGSDSATEDLELSSGNPSSGLGNLDRLIEWHYEVVPDDFERRRNDVIFDFYQGNRNPFVDRPEFVWSVFVDQQNDTQLTLAGGSTNGSGGSTLAVDLGRTYVGGVGPSNQVVTINKSGQDGTYYEVTPSGAATSSVTGSLNAFATGGSGSRGVTVGLNTSTATSGLKTGAVTIDNLDITTGAGAGFGAGDAHDVIDLSFSVLDQPVASFSGASSLLSTTIDLGVVALGDPSPTAGGDLFNFAGAGAPSFASMLDLDSVIGSGDTGVLTTDLGSFTDLMQGDSQGFLVSLDTSTVGQFSADYLLTLSGEDLPGEQQQFLTLTLTGEVVLPGDFNGDGLVNAADYTVWRDTPLPPEDYAIWAANFGASSTSSSSSTAVPEPTGVTLIVLGSLAGILLGSAGHRQARS